MISVAMLATICQMPLLRVASSLILTPQSQEVSPRKLRQEPVKAALAAVAKVDWHKNSGMIKNAVMVKL